MELFFCLYAKGWNDPGQCNSTHSRLLGFFSTVPGIWRALQCLRRYYDTRNAFPHLVNCGKYTFTILFYMSLSLYRIDKNDSLKALFITFATVNSIYCCKFSRCILFSHWSLTFTAIWDLAMDWSRSAIPYLLVQLIESLRSLQPVLQTPFSARRPGLQTTLGVLCRDDPRPYTPFQLDLLRYLLRRAAALRSPQFFRRLFRSVSQRHMDIVPC